MLCCCNSPSSGRIRSVQDNGVVPLILTLTEYSFGSDFSTTSQPEGYSKEPENNELVKRVRGWVSKDAFGAGAFSGSVKIGIDESDGVSGDVLIAGGGADIEEGVGDGRESLLLGAMVISEDTDSVIEDGLELSRADGLARVVIAIYRPNRIAVLIKKPAIVGRLSKPLFCFSGSDGFTE